MNTLFIVDCQNDFLLNDGKLNLGHDTSDLRCKIASYAKDFKGHVVATMDTHNNESCEFKNFPEHCLIHTEGWELVAEVMTSLENRKQIIPQNNDPLGEDTLALVFKTSFSGLELFYSITKELLEGEIHITGVCTHVCVHDIVSSIVNFAKEKFNTLPNIIIHKDMVDDFNPEMSEMSLKRLQNLYGITII